MQPGHASIPPNCDLDSTTGVSLGGHQLNEQVRTLQGQVEAYEREIEHFELVKTDWQIEKEALEDVLMKMREQLREKEQSLTSLQAQKVRAGHSRNSIPLRCRMMKETLHGCCSDIRHSFTCFCLQLHRA